MKVFYHNDMDGIVSARIILNHLRAQKIPFKNEDFIEMDYNKKFPLEEIEKGEQVFIVDYSISPEEMYKLLTKTYRVVWIDHHKSAIEKYKDFETPMEQSKPEWKIPGLRADGIAGCVLTWWYIYGRQSDTEEFLKDYPKNIKCRFRQEIPEYIKLVGDWDVWDHLYGLKTKSYAVCFNARIKSPLDDLFFDKLKTEEDIDKFCEAGHQMIEYRDGWAETFMKRYGFETEIDGHRAFVANLGNGNSEFFGNLINCYDIVGTFCFNGETYTCSLYSTKSEVDCSVICAKRGGGGHKGAAGFVCKELPFKKEEK